MRSIEIAKHIVDIRNWPIRKGLTDMLEELKDSGTLTQTDINEIHLYIFLDRPLFALLMIELEYKKILRFNYLWLWLILPISSMLRMRRVVSIYKKIKSSNFNILLGLCIGVGMLFLIARVFYVIITLIN